MDYKVIIIILFSWMYGLFEFLIGIRQKQNIKVIKTGDKKSLWILIISISLGYTLAFMAATTKTGRIYHWNVFFIIGLILIASGLVIRIISIITLKKQFTYKVAKVKGHELIEKGLYKRIRHPGYLGQLIIFLGFSVSLSNWLSVLLLMGFVLPGFIYRIHTEEHFMVDQFGDKYLEYQKRTKRLIPWLF
jgi:protein-S-isoprenylcysteine O-methyltransferase Ste14